MREMRMRIGIAITTIGALAALAALPPAATASDCSIDNENPPDFPDPGGHEPALLDSGGYEWDVSHDQKGAPGHGQFEDFATLYDGGGETTTTPPAPADNSDSYDGFGALFVGPGGDTNFANQYFSANDESCLREDGGRELVFPALPLSGLTVQRKLFVASSGMPGARLLQLLTNRGGAPVTTQVQIGDTLSEDNYGDLGSDSGTGFRFTSSGDLVLSPADFWAVTSDSTTDNSDFALAHVIDGPGGRQKIDFATLTGTNPLTGDVEDNLAWRWDAVTIQPGQTLALVSFEVQQGVAGGANAPQENANAAAQANAYQGAPAATLFAGMTTSEQAAVANWATTVKCGGRLVTIAGSDVRDKIVGTKRADVIFAGGGNDKVKGKKGNDRICGGPGKDKLIGGAGKKDRLKGGGGKDVEKQ